MTILRGMQSGIDQLRDWMTRRGLNQRETAAYFGWDETFISALLADRRKPGLQNAIAIERHTGIPVEAWVESQPDDSSEPVPAKAKRR